MKQVPFMFLKSFVVVIVSFLLGACATIHRPPTTLQDLQNDADRIRVQQRASLDAIIDTLAKRVVARGDLTLDVLLLSGGGQNGAYGIGFLKGWSARGDKSIPRFDLITGVSTGALQAPFALLGSTTSLEKAAQMYR